MKPVKARNSVADPGFPRQGEGGQSLSLLGQKPIIWRDFCRKMDENERNGTGGHASLAPHLDPPMEFQLLI